jgi:hypothetical protein
MFWFNGIEKILLCNKNIKTCQHILKNNVILERKNVWSSFTDDENTFFVLSERVANPNSNEFRAAEREKLFRLWKMFFFFSDEITDVYVETVYPTQINKGEFLFWNLIRTVTILSTSVPIPTLLYIHYKATFGVLFRVIWLPKCVQRLHSDPPTYNCVIFSRTTTCSSTRTMRHARALVFYWHSLIEFDRFEM